MENAKIIEALQLHAKQMEERFIGGSTPPERNPEATSSSAQIRHMKWMVEEATRLVREGHREKAMRWLGFIQGGLWVMGLSSIEESRQANMP